MAAVTVVVPWRAGCPWRERAWDLARSWWSAYHPDWEVLPVGDGGDGPWRKGLAVWRGLQGIPGDRPVVVCDADVLPYGAGKAVELVTAGAGWVVPFTLVRRLTQDTTATLPAPPSLAGAKTLPADAVYRGFPGGGCVVLAAGTARDVPIDPRFGGWGQEDDAWNLALSALVGGHRRVDAPLAHLWHPPAPRLSRGVGSAESRALWLRYRTAATRPLMRALVDEARDHLVPSPL